VVAEKEAEAGNPMYQTGPMFTATFFLKESYSFLF